MSLPRDTDSLPKPTRESRVLPSEEEVVEVDLRRQRDVLEEVPVAPFDPTPPTGQEL